VPSPLATRIVIGLSAGLWLALAFALDAPVDKTWLKYLGGIASVVVVLLLIFDRWAWRRVPVAMARRPNLQGTWKAQLHYQWPDGSPTQTKDCFIVIRQTYSTVTVDMHFDISDSHSRSAAIVETNGRRSLWWSYLSVAHSLEQEGNPPHRGGAELVISPKPKLTLAGDYWTERKTRGRLTTSGRSKRLYDDYESAAAASYSG
jgi:pimeloyl-ACP methyl ester carboxylesterase